MSQSLYNTLRFGEMLDLCSRSEHERSVGQYFQVSMSELNLSLLVRIVFL